MSPMRLCGLPESVGLGVFGLRNEREGAGQDLGRDRCHPPQEWPRTFGCLKGLVQSLAREYGHVRGLRFLDLSVEPGIDLPG